MEEGDLVLGKVEKVTNTVTTVRLEDGSEATIISSEIAPGRIKFMRHYVVPNKQIICKILEIQGDHIHLSLRRVTAKEKKEAMQKIKIERAHKAALSQLFKEDFEKRTQKILSEFSNITAFIHQAREDLSTVESFIPKKNQEAFKKILAKRQKSHQLKQIIEISCHEDAGLTNIKKSLTLDSKKTAIAYISGGKFSLRLTVEDFKEGKKKLGEINETLKKQSQKNNCEITIHEEK